MVLKLGQPSLVPTRLALSKPLQLDGKMKTTTSWIKATFPSTFARVAMLVSSPLLLALYLVTALSWTLLCFTILVILLLILWTPRLALNLYRKLKRQ
jgi:hypothetical protein